MEYTYDELHHKTVAQLRAIAKELDHDELRGYTQLHKHELLPILCQVLGIEAHEHHEVIGINKPKIKAKIRKLKTEREKAISGKDRKKLKKIRREIRSLKRTIRKAQV